MKLTKKIKPKIPRRLKKALTMSRPYWYCDYERSDGNWIIFKEVKEQKRNIKENKHSLKIKRSLFGETTLDGYPIDTYSINELKILENLLTQVLGEVNEYIKD